jgi:hypothetical protein
MLRLVDRLSSAVVPQARRRPWRSVPPSAAIVAAACAAAITSALGGARIVQVDLEGWRERYGAMEPSEREGEVARSIGLDVSAWERLRRLVGVGDRYAIVASVPEQHEVRNYASYLLLPAIQVAEVADANVVIYYAPDSPLEPGCIRIGRMCLVRLEAS